MFHKKDDKKYIRGVNIGGWLVPENFITPYFFALTECDLKGDFRYFEGQIDAPPQGSPYYKKANYAECLPVPREDYPKDLWDMNKLFRDANNGTSTIVENYFNIHYDNMVKREDISELKAGGVTHVRVPMGHWILGDIEGDEPYVQGGWSSFARVVQWCREDGIQVWPDLHGAPGSQNGFDNSGLINLNFEHGWGMSTCIGWDGNATDSYLNETGGVLPYNVERSLRVIDQITSRFVSDGMSDVVTGFGILNEPFQDCNSVILEEFYNRGLDIMRRNMGRDIHVYVGDKFHPERWQDDNGFWSGDNYTNTYLDSHFYHLFNDNDRGASARQNVAIVCEGDRKYASSCCHDDNGKPRKGMGRISTEFSAASDRLIDAQLLIQMNEIHNKGMAYDWDRELSVPRMNYLRNFVEAQMVNLESDGFSGWFFWNFKMEGGYAAEWSYLRGLREGWIPHVPAPEVPCEDVFGSCFDILERTEDDPDAMERFPAEKWHPSFDDDVVSTHGNNLHRIFGKWSEKREFTLRYRDSWVASFLVVVGLVFVFMKCRRKSEKDLYTKIPETESQK